MCVLMKSSLFSVDEPPTIKTKRYMMLEVYNYTLQLLDQNYINLFSTKPQSTEHYNLFIGKLHYA